MRAQPAAKLGGLVDHRLEAQLHQFVRRHQAGDARTYDGHLFTVAFSRDTAKACRVFKPVVESEGKVRAKDGDRLLAVGGVAVFLVHEVTLPEGLRGEQSLSIGDAWWSF